MWGEVVPAAVGSAGPGDENGGVVTEDGFWCRSCEHTAYVHDRYDEADRYPTCCAPGCRCGHPGDAVVTRYPDGTVTVQRADHLIAVAHELLRSPDLEPWVLNGEILQLDTAGE